MESKYTTLDEKYKEISSSITTKENELKQLQDTLSKEQSLKVENQMKIQAQVEEIAKA